MIQTIFVKDVAAALAIPASIVTLVTAATAIYRWYRQRTKAKAAE